MNKKLLTGIALTSLTATVAIGGTLAYLSARTDTATNVFTMGSGLTGILEEPKWNPQTATNFTPSQIIAKDPMIKNTSAETTAPAYVGATLEYQIQDAKGEWESVPFNTIDQFINVKTGKNAGFNTDKWEFNENHSQAVYLEKVASGAKTDALFTAIEIDPLALTKQQVDSATGDNVQFNMETYKKADGSYSYTAYEMKNFRIVVTGYLVQGSSDFEAKKEDGTIDTAKSALHALQAAFKQFNSFNIA